VQDPLVGVEYLELFGVIQTNCFEIIIVFSVGSEDDRVRLERRNDTLANLFVKIEQLFG